MTPAFMSVPSSWANGFRCKRRTTSTCQNVLGARYFYPQVQIDLLSYFACPFSYRHAHSHLHAQTHAHSPTHPHLLTHPPSPSTRTLWGGSAFQIETTREVVMQLMMTTARDYTWTHANKCLFDEWLYNVHGHIEHVVCACFRAYVCARYRHTELWQASHTWLRKNLQL